MFFPANVLRKYTDAHVFCCHFAFQIIFGIRFPALAQALGTSETEEAIDLLMELVESKDQDILEAACESLKKVGDDHNATELLRILQTIPEENEPLRKKISETIQALHKRG